MVANLKAMRGMSQVELLLGVALALGMGSMLSQAWGLLRMWQIERDQWQELQDRTPALQRTLSRLTRQAGGQVLIHGDAGWSLSAPYEALPAGSAPTWVHARALHDNPSQYPNCQNTRVWAQDPSHAPEALRDQFGWVDGQLKCKDTAQTNARWQAWVDQVRGWKVWLAWRSGTADAARWQWRPVDAVDSGTVAIGVRLCLSMDSLSGVATRPAPPLDCQDRVLPDQGRLWRVWTRVWALRIDRP